MKRLKLISGQTLIEVIVALVLVEFALISIASAGVVSVRNGRLARERAEARSIAETIMEGVRLERDADAEGFFARSSGVEALPTQGSGVVYSPELRYTRIDDDQMQVSVEVSWSVGGGQMHVREESSFNRWQ